VRAPRPRSLATISLIVIGGCATRSAADRDRWMSLQERREEALLEDAADRSLDQHSLLNAAFIISGGDGGAAEATARRRLVSALDQLSGELEQVKDPGERARRLLVELHARVLKRYLPDATTLLDIAERGEFNCVSSAVLYNIMADRLDVPAKAVVVPSHVYAVVFTADGPIEVETTAPDGFAPDRSSRAYMRFIMARELHPGIGAVSVTGDVLRRERELAAEIDNITLLSLMLTNRAALDHARGDEEGALRRLQRARRLVQEERRSLVAEFEATLANNLAHDAARRGDVRGALRIIDAAPAEARGEVREMLEHNRKVLCGKLVRSLLEAGRYQEAATFIEQQLEAKTEGWMEARYIAPELQRLHVEVHLDWLQALAEAEQHVRAREVMSAARQRYPEDPRLLARDAAQRQVLIRQLLDEERCDQARLELERAQSLGAEDVEWTELQDDLNYCD